MLEVLLEVWRIEGAHHIWSQIGETRKKEPWISERRIEEANSDVMSKRNLNIVFSKNFTVGLMLVSLNLASKVFNTCSIVFPTGAN
jgi:hypothetical protein